MILTIMIHESIFMLLIVIRMNVMMIRTLRRNRNYFFIWIFKYINLCIIEIIYDFIIINDKGEII